MSRNPFTKPAPVAVIDQATDAAKKYLHDLMMDAAHRKGTELDEAERLITEWMANPANTAKRTVSDNIDRLKAEGHTGWRHKDAPRGGTQAPSDSTIPDAETVPEGRYAVPTEDGAVNTLAFYRVDRPTEGRWAGYVFVKLMVSDDERNLSRDTGHAILRKIAEIGAEGCSAAYGLEFGHCGVCGRGLTNDDSRARGIGPKCAANLGW